jgi:hypothetical protein
MAARKRTKAVKDARARYRVRAYRKRMRAKGMRLIQMWLPDTGTPEFRREARRQALAISRSPHAAEDQAFVDAISEGVPD